MPWWSWIVIWIALVALSLLYVGLLGVKVFRDATRTMRAFSDAGASLGEYQRLSVERLDARPAPEPAGGELAPGAAIFAEPEALKAEYLAGRQARRQERVVRRVARRAERGQLQSLRDIETLKDVG